MGALIAVHVGEDGYTASLYEKGVLTLYGKREGSWQTVREKAFFLDRSLGIKDLRIKMREVPDFLAGCRVFVGLGISGLPYFELEKSNISIWEFEGKPKDFLDYILLKEEQEEISRKDLGMPVIEELSGGCCRISIKKLQEENSGITSKQVLLPIIRRGGFYSLEIHCNHIPPWLLVEIENGSLSGEIKTISRNEVFVTVKKRSCS